MRAKNQNKIERAEKRKAAREKDEAKRSELRELYAHEDRLLRNGLWICCSFPLAFIIIGMLLIVYGVVFKEGVDVAKIKWLVLASVTSVIPLVVFGFYYILSTSKEHSAHVARYPGPAGFLQGWNRRDRRGRITPINLKYDFFRNALKDGVRKENGQ